MKAGVKKITYVFLGLLFLCLILSGCGKHKALKDENQLESQMTKKQADTEKVPDTKKEKADKPEKNEATQEEAEEDYDEKVNGSNFSKGELIKERSLIENEKNYNYYYSKLSESDKNLYAQMYIIIKELRTDEKLITLNADKADAVFMALMADHPLLYYITGYSINKYTLGERVTELRFSGTYTKTAEEIKKYDLLIKEYEDKCLAGFDDGDDDYSKIKHIYEYIIRNTEYDIESDENQNILSVFVNGKSVCQGYAKATQYLLSKAGIPSILVSGTVKSGESHAWNMVMSNNKWYFIDTTWGDASYSAEYGDITPDICYDYLCVNGENLRRTHRIESKYTLPSAISLDDYYFVREGTYFKWADLDKFKNLVVDYTNQGKTTLVIKCANSSVYDEMLEKLIGKQRLLDIFYDKENVRYARMDEGYSILFEL